MATAEAINAVRFLIADLDPDKQLLSEEQITAALTAEGGSDLLAAARCLDTIAVSEALIGKKIRSQDLSTDGPAVAAELRAQADRLRTRAREQTEDGAFDGFDLAPVQRGTRRPEHTNGRVDDDTETWGL